jgi:hypothetical protein
MIRHILENAQKQLQEEYKGMLWVNNFCVYYGTKHDVNLLLLLLARNNEELIGKIEAFDLVKHTDLIKKAFKPIDAKREFYIQFQPGGPKDIVLYKGKEYRVDGFWDDGTFGIYDMEKEKSVLKESGNFLRLKRLSNGYETIYVERFNFHKNDRIKAIMM